ncbi:MAG TPA: beta-ketoacyl synthase N-terminal-like domain-containing protein [Candidatus Dormibacteraeota bacterium]|nr:beta-ketoacyl synthase N-terminal-like domain-containing protein [Candidatus Dormibacteraeota bacterium]
MSARVVITGGGAISPFGPGVAALIRGVTAGRTCLERTGRTCAARVRGTPGPGSFHPNVWRRLDRCSRLAAVAAQEALLAAGYRKSAEAPAGPADLGLVMGTVSAGVEPLRASLTTRYLEGPECVSPMLFPFTVPNAPASQCSILFGLRGPNLTLGAMEASGLAAIVTAAGLVRDGVLEAALAGGADEWVEELDRAWDRLRATYRGEPAGFPGPFSRGRRGFTPGEGAFFVLLESTERARARGAAVWAEVAGESLTHAAAPAHGWPAGPEGPAEAFRLALSQARVRPRDLGCVAASANGSRALDAIEARALGLALGGDLRRIPVTSVKGAVGESGSASACTALVAALSVRDGSIPPVAGLTDPDPDLGLDLVIGAPRPLPVPSVLVSALGSGGSCAALVLSRPALSASIAASG